MILVSLSSAANVLFAKRIKMHGYPMNNLMINLNFPANYVRHMKDKHHTKQPPDLIEKITTFEDSLSNEGS
jgi:hypothetical protein